MKRITVSLATAALVLSLGAVAHADETTNPAPATTPATQPETKAATPMHHSGKAHKAAPMVDLNTATKEQLMTLPGIDDATADKIIAARPFTMRSELIKKSLVSKAEYSKLRGHVTVKKA